MKAGQTAVAYDSECGYYVGIEQVGEGCVASECKRKLRRRVGWICEQCEERNIFFNEKSFKEHGHDA